MQNNKLIIAIVAIILVIGLVVGGVLIFTNKDDQPDTPDTYEPDGGTVTQYEYDSSECNRTIVVSCVDESGNLLRGKQIRLTSRSDRIRAEQSCV